MMADMSIPADLPVVGFLLLLYCVDITGIAIGARQVSLPQLALSNTTPPATVVSGARSRAGLRGQSGQ